MSTCQRRTLKASTARPLAVDGANDNIALPVAAAAMPAMHVNTINMLANNADGGRSNAANTAKASIGGKLAQIGQRLIDGAAKQIADDFFTRFTAAVSAQPLLDGTSEATDMAAEGPAEPPAPPETKAKPPHHEGISTEIWVVGLIAVVVVLLVFFGLVL